MYATFDKERVRQLAQLILDAVSDVPVAPIKAESEGVSGDASPDAPAAKEDEKTVYNTAEVAKLLGVGKAWVVRNVDLFPGSFRLSESQRANWRFPKEGVDRFIESRRVG